MSTDSSDVSVMLRSPGAVAASLPALVGFTPTQSLVAVLLVDQQVIVTVRCDLSSELMQAWPYLASAAAKVQADEVILAVCCPRGSDALTDADVRADQDVRAEEDVLADEGVTSSCSGFPYPDGFPYQHGVDALRAAFEDAGITVRDVLLLDSDRYWSYLCQGMDCCPVEGTVIPQSGLLETVQVGCGLPASAQTRDAFRARYAPRPDLAPRDAAAEAGARIQDVPLVYRVDQVWDAVQMLARHGAQDSDLDGILRTRVSVAVADVRVRDYVLARMAQADDPRPLLDALVRVALTAPESGREPVAAMAAAAMAALGESTVVVGCLLDLAGEQSLARIVRACIHVPMLPAQLRGLLVEALPQVMQQIADASAQAQPSDEPAASDISTQQTQHPHASSTQ